jgi:hypothetical protein
MLLAATGARPASGEDEAATIQLSVPAGAPLRLYLTKKIPKSLGAPVEGKLMEPIYAFDREVVPAGSLITGKVSRVEPIGKMRRFQTILNGDFTPLRGALVEFDSLTLPDGRKLAVHTAETVPLNSIYVEPSTKQKPPKKNQKTPAAQNPNGGILGTAKQNAKDRVNAAINARTRGVADIVRGPNKKEKLVDFVWAKSPYHPQNVRRGTRFDAPLEDPLEFGTETLKAADLTELGTQPSADTVVRARLLTELDSASAKAGDPVEALVAAPLYSAEHKLLIPAGTHIIGTVSVANKARTFHRGGQLRFNFQRIELPAEIANWRGAAPGLPQSQKNQATLDAAEGSGPARIKVDSEGGVQAQESKTRFIAPALALLIASKAADTDADHHGVGGSGGEANVGGRTLGGGLGFGLLGAAVSQSSPYVGMAFGYYGLAWSVYSSVIARGGEVQFNKNAMLDIRLTGKTPPAAATAAPAPAAKF